MPERVKDELQASHTKMVQCSNVTCKILSDTYTSGMAALWQLVGRRHYAGRHQHQLHLGRQVSNAEYLGNFHNNLRSNNYSNFPLLPPDASRGAEKHPSGETAVFSWVRENGL